jgi:hypothetical protein
MIDTLGDTIWIGLGIALNPVAIVLSVLIANRPDARRNGVAYVLGWLCGLALLVALPALLLHERLGPMNGRHEEFIARFSLFRAALGVVLLAAAVVSLARGPLPGDQPADPRWARVLESGGVGRVFGMGAFVSIVNVRNLVLLAAAASLIGQAALDDLGVALVTALFIAIATLGVLLPLLLHLFGGPATDARLQATATWLTRHMGLITGVIMAIFGALLLTRGIQGVI